MTDIHFDTFQRKTFPVQAVQVTPLNMEALTQYVGGKLMHDDTKEGNLSRDYIKVPVDRPRDEEQTRARLGCWIVKKGKTFQVYTDGAFRKTFELKDGRVVTPGNTPRVPVSEGRRPQKKNRRPQQGQQRPTGPSPAQMPKKRTPVEPTPEDSAAVLAGELSDMIANGASQREIEKKLNGSFPGGAMPGLAESFAANLETTNPEAAQARRTEELVENPVTRVEDTPLQDQVFETKATETVPEDRVAITLDELNRQQ